MMTTGMSAQIAKVKYTRGQVMTGATNGNNFKQHNKKQQNEQ
jgi:hypothetical protein